MPNNLMRNAVRLMRRGIQRYCAIRATYHSVSADVVYDVSGMLVPQLGSATGETSTGLQFTEVVQTFYIEVRDLPVTPARHDIISWERQPEDEPGVFYDYQLLTNGGREYEPVGNFHDTWVLHTKEVPADDV